MESPQINVRLPIDLWGQLRKEANSRGIPVSSLVRIFIHNGLNPKEPLKV